MRTKILPIVLAPKTYKRLEREAYAQERDPLQQARWIIRQALGEQDDARSATMTTGSPGPEAAA